MSKPRSQLVWVWLSLLVVVIDQTSKFFISTFLTTQTLVPLLPFLNFILSYNTGAAFSLLSQAGGWQDVLFIAIAVVMAGFILRVFYQSQASSLAACGMSLILGGAVGNVLDRIRYHHVIDFIDFYINSWHFATFNIADSAISVGAVLWIIAIYRNASNEFHG